jgi:predicted TIM-barrel fold metal-dependent hydrolase
LRAPGRWRISGCPSNRTFSPAATIGSRAPMALRPEALQEAGMTQRGDREEDVWLSDAQLAQLARADDVDHLHSPVPTRMVSNGEHMPIPQTTEQKQVERRIESLADSCGRRLGLGRRRFLAGAGGVAASFLAMNEVYGQFFSVDREELYQPEAALPNAPPAELFVFDDQLHMVRSSQSGPLLFLAFVQGESAAAGSAFKKNPFQKEGQVDELGRPWAALDPKRAGVAINGESLHLSRFIQDVYFDSQVTVGLLSAATLGVFPPGDPNGRPPQSYTESQQVVNVTARQTAAIRNFINRISGSQRMLAHGQIYPGVPNLEFMERQIQENHPDSWKGYNIAYAAKADDDPSSPMRRWRLDDEKIVYPTYELIARHKEQLDKHPGFFNICIHKGFSPSPVDTPEMGNPIDIPKASRDWPQFNFIIYHACWGGMVPFAWSRPVLDDIVAERNYLNDVPNLPWLTQFGQTCGQLANVYAEIGSTFANNVVTWPTVCAHMLGQLMMYFGEDRIVFGSDCVFNGSPQWQIEALWRFQIPEEMRRRFGYPELTATAKRKILGLNSARLYKVPAQGLVAGDGGSLYKPLPRDYENRISLPLKALLEYPGLPQDKLAQARREYLAAGATPSHTRYGWVHPGRGDG